MKNRQLQKLVNRLAIASFKDGRIIESEVIRSIKLLKIQPKSRAIPSMFEYLRSLKRQQRQHTLYIETVIPLSQNQLNKIKKFIEKKVKVTKIVTKINPEILGSFRLQVGDEIWDESILAKLNQVKEAIIHDRHN